MRLTVCELMELLSKAEPTATVTFRDIKGFTSTVEPIQDVIIREEFYPNNNMTSEQSVILVNRSLTRTVPRDEKYDEDDDEDDDL